MLSVRPTDPLFAATCLLLGAALVGCTTTQQTAARLRLHSERLLASRKPVQVRRVDPDVEVVRTSLIHSAAGTAVAVVLRNVGREIVNDLPLVVGVRAADGQVEYLNSARNTPYFQAHAPALAPSKETTWVFSSPHKVSAGSAFARVGVAPSPPLTVARDLPKLDVSKLTSPKRGGGVARVEVTNTSGVTQYDLAVYAAAQKSGRSVAAGEASLTKLDPGDSTTLNLKLIGNARGAPVHVYAAPTIFD